MRRGAGFLALTAALVAFSRNAEADVRADVELEEGGMRRVLTSKPGRGGDAALGPLLEASAHVALVPLLRVGLYAHYDASPVSGQETRDVYSGGADLRLTLPLSRGDLRAYVRLGVGEALTYAGPHAFVGSPSEGSSFAPSAYGNFTELPLALGALHRLEPRLWLAVEAGARVGFGFAGSAYGASSTRSSGDDTIGVFASAGVMWGR